MDTLRITTLVGFGLVIFIAAMRRILIRPRARRNLEKLLKDVTGQTSHTITPRALEDPTNGIVAGNPDGLRIGSERGVWELRWDEVEEVYAFKRDLLTTDLICLAFKKSGADLIFEINEEMAGYQDMMELLPHRLPGFSREWFAAVAYPAFAANHQVIWKKGPDTPR
jgi:hypothetical protein